MLVKRKKNEEIKFWLVISFIAGFSLASLFFIYLKKDKGSIPSDKIIEMVGRVVDLPVGEEPTIATVTDPQKLKEKPFFVNAKEGDKVLLYPEAGKAYLYRPSENRIIEVAPLGSVK